MQVPLDVKEGKGDLLCHLIMQEINQMRDDIERALREEQKEIAKPQTELCASQKGFIRSHTKRQHKSCKKSN